MRRLLYALAVVLPLVLTGAVPGCSDGTGTGSGCCKVCRDGKACGDSCIAKDKTCNVGPGCACNG